MSQAENVIVISACMRRDGTPTFARNEVAVTTEEVENGVHYYLVERELFNQGYEEPYVHFSQAEAPSFLFPAVEQFLGIDANLPEPIIHFLSEK